MSQTIWIGVDPSRSPPPPPPLQRNVQLGTTSVSLKASLIDLPPKFCGLLAAMAFVQFVRLFHFRTESIDLHFTLLLSIPSQNPIRAVFGDRVR